jgi:hypothetical protein
MPDDRGECEFCELKASCDRRVKSETREVAEEWLQQCMIAGEHR